MSAVLMFIARERGVESQIQESFNRILEVLTRRLDLSVTDKQKGGSYQVAVLSGPTNDPTRIIRARSGRSWFVSLGNPAHGTECIRKASEKTLQGWLEDDAFLDRVKRFDPPHVTIVAEEDANRIHLFTDLIGLQHVHLYEHPQGWFLCSSALALARVLPATFSPEGIACYLGIAGMAKDLTFWSEIRKVEDARHLKWQNGVLTSSVYWTPPYDSPPIDDLEQALELFDRTMERALAARLGTGPVAVETTGGMDTRILLGLIRRQSEDCFAWSFGPEDNAEVRVAHEVARVLDCEHVISEPQRLSEDTLLADCRKMFWRSDAERDLLVMGRLPGAFRKIEAQRKYQANGLGGELFRGFYYPTILPSAFRGEERWRRNLMRWMILANSLVQQELYSDGLNTDPAEVVRRWVDSYLDDSCGRNQCTRSDDLYLRFRVHRQLGRTYTACGYYYQPFSPFFSCEAIELSARLAPSLKANSFMLKEWLRRRFPALADIPMVAKGKPKTSWISRHIPPLRLLALLVENTAHGARRRLLRKFSLSKDIQRDTVSPEDIWEVLCQQPQLRKVLGGGSRFVQVESLVDQNAAELISKYTLGRLGSVLNLLLLECCLENKDLFDS